MTIEMKKSRWSRIKTWTSENEDFVVAAAVYSTCAVVIGGLCALAWKEAGVMAEQMEQQQREIEKAVSEGKTVLPSPYGYWIIDNN